MSFMILSRAPSAARFNELNHMVALNGIMYSSGSLKVVPLSKITLTVGQSFLCR